MCQPCQTCCDYDFSLREGGLARLGQGLSQKIAAVALVGVTVI